ncbi:MAG: capsular biosynthesis protein [Gammaproteobacteria bacterium]|nr:capsular biosynthesis protein [Gammaproteobacteria bacterium]MCH9716781.1 capsular biosynthesis protein [Gammaproteobacteria bacterium]MCH9763471.1 capsular biosynthesis protein [Gammaproteobacteria bacterium]
MIVDAVVTWVDGADEAHVKKRLNHQASISSNTFEAEAILPTRFSSLCEIDFCLKSLLKFAPWLRTIYIITDGQTPAILKAWEGSDYAHRFQVIDHHDIFRGFSQYLPTFNSLSIESMLWRIPDLSEQFIYLNDDCFLLRPLEPSAFFQEGKPVLRGRWKTQTAHQWKYAYKRFLGKEIIPVGHRRFQENSAKAAGFKTKFMHLPHVPFPLLKQTFVDFFQNNPEALLDNLQHAFRSDEQMWSISLAYHLGLKYKQVVIDNRLHGVSMHPAFHTRKKIQKKLKKASRDSNTVFACMQSLDQATPAVRAKLVRWLAEVIN